MHKQWKTETLIIHKTCEVYSLWFFEELLELIGISRGVHLDLSNGVSTTVCGVFLIPRFLFVINNGSRSPIRICPENDLGFPFVVGSRYSWRGSHQLSNVITRLLHSGPVISIITLTRNKLPLSSSTALVEFWTSPTISHNISATLRVKMLTGMLWTCTQKGVLTKLISWISLHNN